VESLPLAIEGLPASALRIGGDGTPLEKRDLAALQLRVKPSLPKEFLGDDILRAGWRYGPVAGHELIELFLGRPYDNDRGSGAPIDSIHISHLFLLNGRVVASDGFSRVSGREEHVDQEPPQLDKSNWFVDSFVTLGFLSLDGGSSWLYLSRDEGFEGIDWLIGRLSKDMPLVWNLYLYTPH